MKDKARWQELCEQVSIEQDPAKLMALVKEITCLLDEKHQRLKGPPKQDEQLSAVRSSPWKVG